MKVVKAKYNDIDNKTVLVTLDNKESGIVTLDGVGRKYTYYYDEFIKDGGLVDAFETDAEKEVRLSKELLEDLMTLCDTKQTESQKLILGLKATPLQLKRYDDKYERAKAGEFEDAVNQAIITKYEQARSAIRNFVDLIEFFRGAVDDLIKAKEFDKAKRLIEAGRGLDASTTTEQIQQLLGGV